MSTHLLSFARSHSNIEVYDQRMVRISMHSDMTDAKPSIKQDACLCTFSYTSVRMSVYFLCACLCTCFFTCRCAYRHTCRYTCLCNGSVWAILCACNSRSVDRHAMARSLFCRSCEHSNQFWYLTYLRQHRWRLFWVIALAALVMLPSVSIAVHTSQLVPIFIYSDFHARIFKGMQYMPSTCLHTCTGHVHTHTSQVCSNPMSRITDFSTYKIIHTYTTTRLWSSMCIWNSASASIRWDDSCKHRWNHKHKHPSMFM